jgi:hypothetical protein
MIYVIYVQGAQNLTWLSLIGLSLDYSYLTVGRYPMRYQAIEPSDGPQRGEMKSTQQRYR